MLDWSSCLVDPTNAQCQASNTALATRKASLHGATLGLLDNGKASGAILLEELARRLSDQFRLAGVRRYAKADAGLTLDGPMVSAITTDCDVVITAVGDCGSCSAATVADGILLERAGTPTVSICTDAFNLSGDSMALVYGFPHFPYVRLPHPVASLSLPEICRRVEAALPHIVTMLTESDA